MGEVGTEVRCMEALGWVDGRGGVMQGGERRVAVEEGIAGVPRRHVER